MRDGGVVTGLAGERQSLSQCVGAGFYSARGRGRAPPLRKRRECVQKGRTESSAPTKQNKNRAKRDVGDAVPYEGDGGK